MRDTVCVLVMLPSPEGDEVSENSFDDDAGFESDMVVDIVKVASYVSVLGVCVMFGVNVSSVSVNVPVFVPSNE